MQLPDEVIVNHTKYKMLQTQFNLFYNDALEVDYANFAVLLLLLLRF